MGWDILLDSSGDLPHQTQHVRDDDLRIIAQRAHTRLHTHQGEWLLDIREGLPYLTWLGTKPTPLIEIKAKVQRELETIPYVSRVVDLRVEQNASTVSISGKVYTTDGEELELTGELGAAVGNSQPFVFYFGRSGGVV